MKQFKPSDFAVLKYVLPSKPAELYTAQAIELLQGFNLEDLPYFLASDIVLTLSGVRAYDTYITFEGMDPDKVTYYQKYLAAHGFVLECETSEYDEPGNDFFYLVNCGAITDIQKQYQFDGWFNPHAPYTPDRMHVWNYHIERTLLNMMANGKLPKAWLTDYLSAHNIRFGILLGYPGEAIACGIWMDALGEKQMPNALSSTFAYHDAYDAAWPTYYYTDDVKDNPNVIAHQKLWSDIATGVYESAWHRKLQNTLEFQEAAAKIHAYKGPYNSQTTEL